MVSPLVVEDEYTINVKLRRPLTNGSCLLPPTITITPDDPTITLLPPPNASLTHAQAAKSVNGRPPMMVGCSSIPPRSFEFEGPPWRPCKGNDHLEDQPRAYRKSIMPPYPPPPPPPPPLISPTSPTPPPPPLRRVYQEDHVPDDKITLGCLRLPLVQVFSDENTLVAKNKFSAPTEEYQQQLPTASSSLSSGLKQPTPRSSSSQPSAHVLAPPLPPPPLPSPPPPPPQQTSENDPHPIASGALYVERIPAHCKSGSGFLYVPPVDERCLRRCKQDEPPAKGNSRRRRRSSDPDSGQSQDEAYVEVVSPPPPPRLPPPPTPAGVHLKWAAPTHEKLPSRSSSSKAAARAFLAEVLSPKIETTSEQRPPSPRPPPTGGINFYRRNNNINNNNNYNTNNNNYNNNRSRQQALEEEEEEDSNDDEIAFSKNQKSTAQLNFSVSKENKKNAGYKNTNSNNIAASGRRATSLSGTKSYRASDIPAGIDSNNAIVISANDLLDSDRGGDDDNEFLSPLEGERVVEVYGGVAAAHAHTAAAAHAHTSQPAVSGGGGGGGGRNSSGGHGDPTRPQPVDPALLTSLDLESDHHTHEMLVTDGMPHPAHSRHPHDLNHNDQVFSNQKPPEERNHVSGRAAKYMVNDTVANHHFGGLDNFGFDREVVGGGQDNYGYDPGYSSERSPEEEEGPPLYYRKAQKERENRALEGGGGGLGSSRDRRSLRVGPGEIITTRDLMKLFPFITEGTMFEVTVIKNLRGLGLALTGGIECDVPFAGLVRIKKLYPQTPAWLCGQLHVGDIVLRANTHQLTGLSSHEALEILRTCGQEVSLEVCRPPEGALGEGEDSPDGGSGRVIVTTSLTAPNASHNYLSPSPSFSSCGEFEVELTKVAGSLGFTLRKQDNSILGHTIRTLVKEPAISDGRLRPGDKIISVNNTDMCSLSHEEAIAFLRTCPETVTLKLYRDAMQTPVSPISPTEPDIIVKPKALRKEARDMLTDLAFRKQSPSNSPSLAGATSSPGTPRRRRLQKTPSPDIKSVVADRWDSLVRRTEESLPGSPTLESKVSPLNSIRETDHETSPFGDSQTDDSGSTTIRSRNSSSVSSCSLTPSTSESSRPKRPSFLDLSSGRSCPRKTQFTPPHEVDQSFPSPLGAQYPSADSIDSAPQLTSTHSDTPAFSHLQQGYHSVNLGALHPHEDSRLTNTTSDHNISSHDTEGPTNNGLLKWKGIVFTPEEEDSNSEESLREDGSSSSSSLKSHKPKVVAIELNRGWNSRLGFSLQPQGERTIITAIYADSVAAKDGRLRIGDIVIRVNGVDVVGWDCESIIDLLRKTRGKISLSVIQPPC